MFFGWAWSKYGFGQSGLWNLKLYLKNEQMELSDFLHASINSQKLKVDWKLLGWAWSEMGVASNKSLKLIVPEG